MELEQVFCRGADKHLFVVKAELARLNYFVFEDRRRQLGEGDFDFTCKLALPR